MKNLVFKFTALCVFFYSINAYAADCTEDDEYYSLGVNVALSFMPGKKKCQEYKSYFDNNTNKYYFYRDLKEFIINKNGKYCLWGSSNWDDDCQTTSLKYAYGDYGRAERDPAKFKQVVIDFIKYIQNDQIEKAMQLIDYKAMFFTDDDSICLSKENTISRFPGCRSYFNKLHKNKSEYGDFRTEVFRKNLIKIDADNLKFYLADLSKRQIYSIIIPYEYKNNQKEFSITFSFQSDSLGNNTYIKSIYDLSIYDPITTRAK